MEKDIAKIMQKLIDFEAHTTRQEFQRIFGIGKGNDLWIRFTRKCDSNTTIFYRILEEDEQDCFDKYLGRALDSDEKK